MLEKLGYRADVVGNGVETIEALERQPYDLLLTDVQMPEMDGLEATRKIREQEERLRAEVENEVRDRRLEGELAEPGPGEDLLDDERHTVVVTDTGWENANSSEQLVRELAGKAVRRAGRTA